VVRESEYARTPDDQSFVSKWAGKFQKISEGGAGLMDSDRAAIVRMAKVFLQKSEEMFGTQRSVYYNEARSSGLSPDFVIGELPNQSQIEIATGTETPKDTNFISSYGTPVKVTPSMENALTTAQSKIDIPLQITDSLRSTEQQRKAYESGKEGVAKPGTSFHEKGEAIDLTQVPEMKNEKVFSALRAAGLQQHPDEWWHWSRGEFAPTGEITTSKEGGINTHANDSDALGNTFISHGSYGMNRSSAARFAKENGFKNTDPESEEFKKEWDERAKEKDFIDKEHTFALENFYQPQLNILKTSGIPQELLDNPNFQSLILDVSVNKGAGTKLILKALKGKQIESVEQAIQEITNERILEASGHPREEGIKNRATTVNNELQK